MAIQTYATVGSNDLERAKAFYTALLGSAGITPMFPHPSGGTNLRQEWRFRFRRARPL